MPVPDPALALMTMSHRIIRRGCCENRGEIVIAFMITLSVGLQPCCPVLFATLMDFNLNFYVQPRSGQRPGWSPQECISAFCRVSFSQLH